MTTELIRVESETVQELRRYVIQKYGKMRGLGRETEEAIKHHIHGDGYPRGAVKHEAEKAIHRDVDEVRN